MLIKIFSILGGLLFIGIGIHAIVTRRASIHWTIGNGEPRVDEPPTQVSGWLAVLFGVAAIASGVSIIAKFAL